MSATMNMKKRMFSILIISVVVLSALAVRTGYIQIASGAELQKAAIEQQTRDRVVSSKRGSILDRNGKVLAVSASVETVTVSPVEIKANAKVITAESVAKGLSEVLDMEYDAVLKKLPKIHPMKF